MKIRLFIFSLFFCHQLAADPVIVFNMSPSGYPPFMINDEQQHPSGIMYDVLKRIALKHHYQIQTTSTPRKRVDIQLDSGKLDASARAKEWMQNPEDYVFTDTIIKVRDVIFSSSKTPLIFNNIEDLYGKTISTHLGYKYPMLDASFNKQKIFKSDSYSEEAMLGKVLIDRADAAIVNESVGLWLIKSKPAWQGQFVIAKKILNSFDFRIMFSKKWRPFVNKFNQELANMKKDGELENIISSYK